MKTKLIVLCIGACLLVPLAWSADDKTFPPAAQKAAKIKRVDVEEFDKLRTQKESVVLDVRTEKEFKAGHIPGALNLDVKASDFDKQVGKLAKNKTYLVYCAAGVRSAMAAKRMEGAGLQALYDLAPGFHGWEKAGKPVEK
jgi:phage shock protein E